MARYSGVILIVLIFFHLGNGYGLWFGFRGLHYLLLTEEEETVCLGLGGVVFRRYYGLDFLVCWLLFTRF